MPMQISLARVTASIKAWPLTPPAPVCVFCPLCARGHVTRACAHVREGHVHLRGIEGSGMPPAKTWLRIPTEVARDSGMISPIIPI